MKLLTHELLVHFLKLGNVLSLSSLFRRYGLSGFRLGLPRKEGCRCAERVTGPIRQSVRGNPNRVFVSSGECDVRHVVDTYNYGTVFLTGCIVGYAIVFRVNRYSHFLTLSSCGPTLAAWQIFGPPELRSARFLIAFPSFRISCRVPSGTQFLLVKGCPYGSFPSLPLPTCQALTVQAKG